MVPPSQRTKARFMNLGDLVRWASETLAVLRQPPAVVLDMSPASGWKRNSAGCVIMKKPVPVWSQMQLVIDSGKRFRASPTATTKAQPPT